MSHLEPEARGWGLSCGPKYHINVRIIPVVKPQTSGIPETMLCKILCLHGLLGHYYTSTPRGSVVPGFLLDSLWVIRLVCCLGPKNLPPKKELHSRPWVSNQSLGKVSQGCPMGPTVAFRGYQACMVSYDI